MSGIPISVVDSALVEPPMRIGLGDAGASYVFNAGGQTIELEGLLCLFDLGGPCANAVKDSQRTKTRGETRDTLSVLWGRQQFCARTDRALETYREILGRLGATTEVVL